MNITSPSTSCQIYLRLSYNPSAASRQRGLRKHSVNGKLKMVTEALAQRLKLGFSRSSGPGWACLGCFPSLSCLIKK